MKIPPLAFRTALPGRLAFWRRSRPRVDPARQTGPDMLAGLPRHWEDAPDLAAPATDAAIDALGHVGDIAERVDRVAATLRPPFGRGALRMAMHLRASRDVVARQAGRLALGEHALTCKDVLRVEAEFSAFLDEPRGRSAQSTDRALVGLALAKRKCGELDAALALISRREGHVPDFELGIARARILHADDPDEALTILKTCGAGEGRGGVVGNGLHISCLLARGDLAGAEALVDRIASWPRCTPLAHAYRSNFALARTGDHASQMAALEAFGVTLSASGGFDRIRMAPRDPIPQDDALVSIVMTAFEAETYVATAIGSIMEQTWRNLELIVVDDCSGDGTFSRLEALARDEPRLRVLRTARNGGTYPAKNLGIAAARGDFIALCDADDMWTPDHLAAQMAVMRERPDIAVSMSKWLRIFQDGMIEIPPYGGIVEACPHSTLFRREVFDRIGLFDSVRIGADREIIHRVRLEYGGQSILRLNRVLTLGRRHGASLTTSGAGAISSGETPEIRRIYRTTWVGWHMAQVAAGRPLWNSGRPEERPYPVPDGMV